MEHKKFISFDEWFEIEYPEWKNIEITRRYGIAKWLSVYYIVALGYSPFDIHKKFPDNISKELEKAEAQREEIYNSFTKDDWKVLFWHTYKYEKRICLNRMLALGGTKEEEKELIDEYDKWFHSKYG